MLKSDRTWPRVSMLPTNFLSGCAPPGRRRARPAGDPGRPPTSHPTRARSTARPAPPGSSAWPEGAADTGSATVSTKRRRATTAARSSATARARDAIRARNP